MIKEQKNYLENDYISEVIFNFRKNHNLKFENSLVKIIDEIIKRLQSMPKFSGYSKEIKNDMRQVSHLNFFNNIHDPKFSIRKVAKEIKIKPKDFYINNNMQPINIAGRTVYCKRLSTNKILECYLITDNELDKIEKAKIRNRDGSFSEKDVHVDLSKKYYVAYDDIYFNYFAFITQTVYTSFLQVLNSEHNVREVNQVILWENTDDVHKYDTSCIESQKKIQNIISNLYQNYKKQRGK